MQKCFVAHIFDSPFEISRHVFCNSTTDSVIRLEGANGCVTRHGSISSTFLASQQHRLQKETNVYKKTNGILFYYKLHNTSPVRLVSDY